MINKQDFDKAVDLIDKSKNILITSHTKPDGDACGSGLALAEALTAMGKKVTSMLLSPLPQWYEFIYSVQPFVLGENFVLDEKHVEEIDLVILVDVNSDTQLPKFADYLKVYKGPVLVIDHHVTGDGLGDIELIDTTAAAAGMIVYDLFKHAGWSISDLAAQAIFVAIATDTGWFHFSNTSQKVHQYCAELISMGVKPTQIYHDLYNNFTIERFRLLSAMLDTLELHMEGRLAVQYLLQEDFRKTGATYRDTENLIDECQRIGSVEVAALLVELNDGRFKCSLRSRGSIDVRSIAQKYGGGGHDMAAGFHLPGPIENAMKTVFSEIQEQYNSIRSSNFEKIKN